MGGHLTSSRSVVRVHPDRGYNSSASSSPGSRYRLLVRHSDATRDLFGHHGLAKRLALLALSSAASFIVGAIIFSGDRSVTPPFDPNALNSPGLSASTRPGPYATLADTLLRNIQARYVPYSVLAPRSVQDASAAQVPEPLHGTLPGSVAPVGGSGQDLQPEQATPTQQPARTTHAAPGQVATQTAHTRQVAAVQSATPTTRTAQAAKPQSAPQTKHVAQNLGPMPSMHVPSTQITTSATKEAQLQEQQPMPREPATQALQPVKQALQPIRAQQSVQTLQRAQPQEITQPPRVTQSIQQTQTRHPIASNQIRQHLFERKPATRADAMPATRAKTRAAAHTDRTSAVRADTWPVVHGDRNPAAAAFAASESLGAGPAAPGAHDLVELTVPNLAGSSPSTAHGDSVEALLRSAADKP
jgi:hypothetical protein